MDAERWQQINTIVDTALTLEREQRVTYVEKQCRDDEWLQAQVKELLESIETSRTTGFLEETDAYPRHLAADFVEAGQPEAGPSLVGQQIGRYHITGLIGHGGMGSVYEAERADDAYEQRVALKVMRRGMDTPSNIARFNQERNILASLNHPNIARLLDGGVTDDGLPYLVMEYVDGTPLYEYCTQNRLAVEDRLELFKTVCRAVQHAHTNAVIHRDLKPSNILVTDEGEINVLDFGIAKLLEPGDPNQIFQTQTGARLLTLGYAAPEQVDSIPITTATDTYALGTLLYELLAGVHPLDLQDNSLTEIEHQIRDTTPARPSDKLQNLPADRQKMIARQCQSSPKNLVELIEGDLDAIIMKALRKEPDARYTTPDQLLDDLDRRAANLPILAREDTIRYQTEKFFNRHKTAISVAAGVLLIVFAFVAFHTWRITEERNQAQLEAQRAEAVTTFLTDLIQSNYPENAQGDTITVRQFLDQGFRQVQSMEGTPLVKAEIMNVMGHTYRTLGETQKAKQMIAGTIDLLADHDGSPVEQATALNTAGLIYRDLGNPDTAATHLRKAVQFYRDAGNTETAEFAKALRDLAYVEKQWLNDYTAAKNHINEAIGIDKRVNGPKSAELAESYYIYASLLREQEKYSDALTYQNRSLNILEKNIDGPHPGKSANYNNMAILYKRLDSTRQAIRFYRKSMQMNEELYGGTHFRVANNATNLALQFMENGKLDSALIYNNRAIQIGDQTLSEGHQYRIRIMLNHARIHNRKGAYETADSLFRKALAIADASRNADTQQRGNIYMSWAENALQQGDQQSALNHFRKAFIARKTNRGIQEDLTQASLDRLISLLEQTGQANQADSLSQFVVNKE